MRARVLAHFPGCCFCNLLSSPPTASENVAEIPVCLQDGFKTVLCSTCTFNFDAVLNRKGMRDGDSGMAGNRTGHVGQLQHSLLLNSSHYRRREWGTFYVWDTRRILPSSSTPLHVIINSRARLQIITRLLSSSSSASSQSPPRRQRRRSVKMQRKLGPSVHALHSGLREQRGGACGSPKLLSQRSVKLSQLPYNTYIIIKRSCKYSCSNNKNNFRKSEYAKL